MKIKKEESYILITAGGDPITEFTSRLTKDHEAFKDQNLVVELSAYPDLELEDLLGFLELSNLHHAEKRSFVIVSHAVPMEKIPDELIVVPTLREAEDTVQMDEMQRDLGF